MTSRSHWLARPFQLTLSAWSIVVGLLLLADQVWSGFDPAPSLESLQLPLAVPIGIAFTAGGIGVHYSYWSPRLTLGKAWTLERLVTLPLAGAWFSYGIAVVTSSPSRIVQWGNGIIIGTCFLVRWAAIGKRAQALRGVQRRIRDETVSD